VSRGWIIQITTQYLHAFAVAPTQLDLGEVGGQLLACGESASGNNGLAVAAIEVDALDRAVAGEESRFHTLGGPGVRAAHVGPVDLAALFVEDHAVRGLVEVTDQSADRGAVHGHRLHGSLDQIENDELGHVCGLG
jgi:hypothetical protein